MATEEELRAALRDVLRLGEWEARLGSAQVLREAITELVALRTRCALLTKGKLRAEHERERTLVELRASRTRSQALGRLGEEE